MQIGYGKRSIQSKKEKLNACELGIMWGVISDLECKVMEKMGF